MTCFQETEDSAISAITQLCVQVCCIVEPKGKIIKRSVLQQKMQLCKRALQKTTWSLQVYPNHIPLYLILTEGEVL